MRGIKRVPIVKQSRGLVKFLQHLKQVPHNRRAAGSWTVCVSVSYLEGSVDFYEGVEGGQIKLSDLPPVT